MSRKSIDSKRNKTRQIEHRAWLDGLKSGIPCQDCGICWPTFVCDWHHVDPGEKSFTISDARRNRTQFTKSQILDEIDKCILLCSNCHRIREYS